MLPPGKNRGRTRNFDPRPRILGVRFILLGENYGLANSPVLELRTPLPFLSLEVGRSFSKTPSNDISVYDISVHDISVYDLSVYDISVHDISVHDISVYGISE